MCTRTQPQGARSEEGGVQRAPYTHMNSLPVRGSSVHACARGACVLLTLSLTEYGTADMCTGVFSYDITVGPVGYHTVHTHRVRRGVAFIFSLALVQDTHYILHSPTVKLAQERAAHTRQAPRPQRTRDQTHHPREMAGVMEYAARAQHSAQPLLRHRGGTRRRCIPHTRTPCRYRSCVQRR
eukprot:scaffold85740_cov66-Phaeocystis_antarctica.AAC.5